MQQQQHATSVASVWGVCVQCLLLSNPEEATYTFDNKSEFLGLAQDYNNLARLNAIRIMYLHLAASFYLQQRFEERGPQEFLH